MNSIFKELYDKGAINKTPVWDFDGIKAYEFSDNSQEFTTERFLDFTDIMEAYSRLNLQPDELDTFQEIIDSNLLRAKLDYKNDYESAVKLIDEVQYLNQNMKARREYSIPIRRLFDLASFLIFEEDENPLVYDRVYNKKKVDRWMKSPEVEKKIPYLKFVSMHSLDTSTFFELSTLRSMRQMNAHHAVILRTILSSSSMDGRLKEISSTIESQMETLSKYEHFLTESLRIITDTSTNGTQSN